MKHTSSRDLYGYWDECRGVAQAPDRNDLEPGPVRHLLGDAFVLSYDSTEGHPFRVAGTRLCALLGRDMKGEPFVNLWGRDSRREIGDLVGIVAEETLAAVAGVTAHATDGYSVSLELLLLPFQRKAHAPITVAGVLVPLTVPALDGQGLQDFTLNGWRHMGHRPVAKGPRNIKRWMAARGFTVFEGARSD
jgi:hypothetical protein